MRTSASEEHPPDHHPLDHSREASQDKQNLPGKPSVLRVSSEE
jgi:hypothetical protein